MIICYSIPTNVQCHRICKFVILSGQMDKCHFVRTNGHMSILSGQMDKCTKFVILSRQMDICQFVLTFCQFVGTNGQMYKRTNFVNDYAVLHHLSRVRFCPDKFCHFVFLSGQILSEPPPQEHLSGQKTNFVQPICPFVRTNATK